MQKPEVSFSSVPPAPNSLLMIKGQYVEIAGERASLHKKPRYLILASFGPSGK